MRRPADSYKDPDLDTAWEAYASAIATANKSLLAAVDARQVAARKSGELEAALRYQEMANVLRSEGRMPSDDESLKPAVQATLEAFEQAAATLQKAYRAVVVKLTQDETLDLKIAASVKKEIDALFPAPQPDPKPKPDDGPQIPEDAIQWDGHSYFFVLGEVTQEEAARECKKVGGYLARITTKEEFNMLKSALVGRKLNLTFWIDGTDAGHEGIWTFLDGSNMPKHVWIPWFPNQPDNQTHQSYSNEGGSRYVREDEDGLSVMVSWAFNDGSWAIGLNDSRQSARQGFVCEWDTLLKKKPPKR